MKCLVLLTVLAFASKNENDVESATTNSEGNIMENAVENSIVVKIEEDEYVKKRNSKFIGVSHVPRDSKWRAQRRSKLKKSKVNNGTYKDEETAARASDTLARNLMANGEQNHKLNFPDDKSEVYPDKKREKISNYIGVFYNETTKKFATLRWSKNESKTVCNGTNYKNEEMAGHASDTLARKLMANGEQGHKLNFPEDNTEVHPEERKSSSKYFGVYYDQRTRKWVATRWSKNEKKVFNNGHYKDEETAAHASDTLSRKLIANGNQGHKLNFPDDSTEVYPINENTKTSEYFGVFYLTSGKRWVAQRRSKDEKKLLRNGYHKDEETAAHASDTLARKLLTKGEAGHKLNFPDDNTEVEKRKSSKYFGVTYIEKSKSWYAQRWSKTEKKLFTNGTYRDEETAAHVSDTLARKLMANGEQDHKLNFPDDNTEVHAKKYKTNKRKRSFEFNAESDQNKFEKFEQKEK